MIKKPSFDLFSNSSEDIINLYSHCVQNYFKAKISIHRFVDVIAARPLHVGEELLLNYGDKSMHDFLQSYAFVPADCSHEVISYRAAQSSMLPCFNFLFAAWRQEDASISFNIIGIKQALYETHRISLTS